MPRAGRGEPLAKTGASHRWTDDEYGTLHILEVEYPDLSASQLEHLWHQLHPEHKQKGRNYNASKLHETWAYRHYDGRSSKWARIARPNQKPEVGNATQYNAQERVWFRNLRQRIQVAAGALTPPLALPTPTAQVDAGTMCTCNSCQGIVQTRNGKKESSKKSTTKKGKARGISAKKGGISRAGVAKAKARSGKARPTTQAGSEGYGGTGSARCGSRSTRNCRTRSVTYTDPEDEEEEDWEDEAAGEEAEIDGVEDDEGARENEVVEDEDVVDEEDGDNEYNFGAMALTTAHHTSASGQSGQNNAIGGSARGGSASQSSRSKATSGQGDVSNIRESGEGSGNEIAAEEPTFKMADIERARSALRMVHQRYLFEEEGKLRLPEQNVFVQQDSEVYRHGGQVMTITLPTQQAGAFMVCDTKRCIGCKRSANKNFPSPTEGLPFVHLRQCIRDADSGRLLFSPEDICEYHPADPDHQRLDLGNVVLVVPGLGPRVYRVAVCEIASCQYCGPREANGAPL